MCETWEPVAVDFRQSYYDCELRHEQEWPLARTEYTPLVRADATGTLNEKSVADESTATHDAATGSTTFDLTLPSLLYLFRGRLVRSASRWLCRRTSTGSTTRTHPCRTCSTRRSPNCATT